MEIKEIRAISGLSRPNFARKYNIPYRTLQSWEVGERKCPEYAKDWLKRIVEEDKEEEEMCEKLLKTSNYILPTMEEWEPIAEQVCSEYSEDLAVELENRLLNIVAAKNKALFPAARAAANTKGQQDADLLIDFFIESDKYMQFLKAYVYDCMPEEEV